MKYEKDIFNSEKSHNDHNDILEKAIYFITNLNKGIIISSNINIPSKSCEENDYQICFIKKTLFQGGKIPLPIWKITIMIIMTLLRMWFMSLISFKIELSNIIK